jgi:hypothetical protein
MKRRLVLGAAALAAVGCTHMLVPPEIKPNELHVDEKPGLFSGNLRFGPFRAMAIDKGWTHGSSDEGSRWFGTQVTQTAAQQDYSFRYEEDGQPARLVACRAAYRGSTTDTRLGKGVHASSSEGQETLDCKFGPAGAPAPDGILRLVDDTGRVELGELKLDVRGNHEFDGFTHVAQPIGWVMTSESQPVAAVDTNLIGAWMKKDLAGPMRTAAGLGSTILLLYKQQQPH